MTARRPYPSDISDARWELIGPALLAWQQARIDRRLTGEPARTDVRKVFNALLYLNRTGIAWKYLPHDFPPHGTVYFYYALWRDEGIFAQLNYELTGLARAKEGRATEPSAAIIDTQSIKTSTNPWKHKALTRRSSSSVASAPSPPTHLACCSPSSCAPRPSMRTMPEYEYWSRPRQSTPRSPWPGSTRASRTGSSNTPPPSASTPRSSPETPRPEASTYANEGGSWNGCAVRRLLIEWR